MKIGTTVGLTQGHFVLVGGRTPLREGANYWGNFRHITTAIMSYILSLTVRKRTT